MTERTEKTINWECLYCKKIKQNSYWELEGEKETIEKLQRKYDEDPDNAYGIHCDPPCNKKMRAKSFAEEP